MNGYHSKIIGLCALVLGLVGALAFSALLLFFAGLFQNIPSLLFFGSLNDALNSLFAILSAVLSSLLHPALRRLLAPGLSAGFLVIVWLGALAVTFGSWLIMSGRSDLELSSHYFFFGNGLVGIWLWTLNRIARQQAFWPESLTRLGLIAGGFMILGLLGLYGILMRWDGDNYSPLVMVAGLSYFGTGILYPIWGLLLGRWLLKHGDRLTAPHGSRSVS